MIEKTYMDVGTGMSEPVSVEELTEMQSEARQIADSISENYRSGSWGNSWYTRHCYWANQSPDGRKRAEAFTGTDEGPLPFDGATDARIREADLVINEQAELVVLASMLSSIRVKAVSEEDAPHAGAMKMLLDYYLERMGLKRVRELVRLANFVHGGTPGAGIMGVEWRREMAVELREMMLAELGELAVKEQLALLGDAPQEAQMLAIRASVQGFLDALMDPKEGEEELAALIIRFFPDVKPGRAQTMVRQLRSGLQRGEANPVVEFPHEYLRIDDPEFTALEIGRDVFLPADVSNFEEGWGYFTSELLTKSQVKQQAAFEDWNEEAVEQILGTEKDTGIAGQMTFRRWIKRDGQFVAEGDPLNKNRYEIITHVFRGTTTDGVPGVFQVRFAMGVEPALTDKVLRSDKHGNYPAVGFAREYIDRLLLNSRGVADLEEANQGLVKLFFDTCGDNAQFSGVPPFVSRGRMGGGRAYVAPMEEIRLSAAGRFDFMNPPQYPASGLQMLRQLEKRRNDYWGRRDPELDPLRAQRREQAIVMLWLSQLQEVYVMLLQLIQQYAPEEVVLRVLNEAGVVARSRQAIQGRYDVYVEFDADVLNPEVLEKKLSLMKNVFLAMDYSKRVDAGVVLEYFMYQMNPSLARAAIRPQQEADMGELEDEANVYENIRAGVPSPMPTDGSINAELRIQFYEGLMQANPAVYADMAEDKQVLLQQRMEYLTHQAQQFGENAQTGRTGVSAQLGGLQSGMVRQ